MTDDQLNALRGELGKANYKDLIAKGNDAALLDLLNAPQSDPAYAIPLPVVPVAAFGNILLSARLVVLTLKDPAKQAMYTSLFPDLLAIMQIAGSADLSQPAVSGFMAQATADGLVTQEEMAAVIARPGSIAEKLTGGLLALDDLAFALRGHNVRVEPDVEAETI